MSMQRAFSLFIRIGAASMFLAGLVSHAPPARSAAPAFQATTVSPKVPNLVGYWPMNSATGGVVSDLSGTTPANNGMLTGSAAIDTTNKAAVPSGNPASLGLSAATSDNVVEVPDSASLSVTGSLTVAAWVHPTVANATSGPQHGVIEKWDSAGATVNGYMLRLSPQNYVSFMVANATGNASIDTSPRYIPTNGAWTHVAGVYDAAAGSLKIYHSDDDLVPGSPPNNYGPDAGGADPTMVNSGVAPPTDGTSVLHIGDGLGAQQFGGNIDEARIYSKALTQNEIAILVSMNQPAAGTLMGNGFGPNAVLSWGAASNAASVPVVYSVLRGTTPGVYDTIFNNISATTYTDTPTLSGTYYYNVVAVSVIPSVNQTEVQVITTATVTPPPPPAAPRTSKVGKENDPCGCGSATPPASWAGVLGIALLAAALSIRLRR
ncbi:MAG TPA: LamG domain-containing protein [Planctomycetota bacterium]|nr:LamG domain-containing protein [Planctomycetota bacterium]